MFSLCMVCLNNHQSQYHLLVRLPYWLSHHHFIVSVLHCTQICIYPFLLSKCLRWQPIIQKASFCKLMIYYYSNFSNILLKPHITEWNAVCILFMASLEHLQANTCSRTNQGLPPHPQHDKQNICTSYMDVDFNYFKRKSWNKNKWK